jgi:hypothetical protein
MTTTPLVKSLIDEQLEDCRVTLITAPGQSLCDALGLPPDTRLANTGIRSAMTIKRGRRIVEVRHG